MPVSETRVWTVLGLLLPEEKQPHVLNTYGANANLAGPSRVLSKKPIEIKDDCMCGVCARNANPDGGVSC